MAFLSDALTELAGLAGPVSAVLTPTTDASTSSPLATRPDFAGVLRAIRGAVDAAEKSRHVEGGAPGSGTRVAVCFVELPTWTKTIAAGEVLDAAHAWLLRHLRPGDGIHRVGEALVVVAASFQHPQHAERLADRVQAMLSNDGETPAVGLAIYPVHGDDAATLYERARLSAHRIGALQSAPPAEGAPRR